MKTSAIIFGGLVVVLAYAGQTAEARVHGARAQASPAEAGHAYRNTGPYQWCADYNNTTGNCGFDTFEQCMESARGNGGGCIPNPRYNPGGGTPGAPSS